MVKISSNPQPQPVKAGDVVTVRATNRLGEVQRLSPTANGDWLVKFPDGDSAWYMEEDLQVMT